MPKTQHLNLTVCFVNFVNYAVISVKPIPDFLCRILRTSRANPRLPGQLLFSGIDQAIANSGRSLRVMSSDLRH